MAKKTLTFFKVDGKGWVSTFTSVNGLEHIQIAKNPNENGLTYIEASADGNNFATVTAPDSGRNLLIPIEVPEGVLLRVVSTDPVYYAAVISRGEVTQYDKYFYFEAAQAGSTVSFRKDYAYSQGDAPDLEYSRDGVTFKAWPYTTETTTMGGLRHTFDPITLSSVGDRVYLRGDNESFGDSYSADSSVFLLSGRLHCGGDIRSIFARDLSATVARFHPMMCDYSGDHFALLNAPDIRAWQSVAMDAFNGFLSYCEAVTELPSDYLPWTELAEGCYRGMFMQSGIRKAPILPAASVPSRAYVYAFWHCANLNEIESHATELEEGATANMTEGVAGSGVFRKSAAMESWPQGADGIPEGWTVENI